MEYVKLTDGRLQTYNGYQWAVGEKRTVSGAGELCTEGWLYCYGAETQGQAVLLALLLNPIHGDFPSPIRCFSAKCGGQIRSDSGLKFGVTEMTLREEITPIPEITTITRVAFAILCAMEFVKERTFVAWGEGWLSGEDRSLEAAEAAEWAAAGWAASEAWSAARAERAELAGKAATAAERAAFEAWSAAGSAWSAARAARRAAAAVDEAEVALEAARAAERAARRAARRATRAVASCGFLPLGELAEKAMEIS